MSLFWDLCIVKLELTALYKRFQHVYGNQLWVIFVLHLLSLAVNVWHVEVLEAQDFGKLVWICTNAPQDRSTFPDMEASVWNVSVSLFKVDRQLLSKCDNNPACGNKNTPLS